VKTIACFVSNNLVTISEPISTVKVAVELELCAHWCLREYCLFYCRESGSNGSCCSSVPSEGTLNNMVVSQYRHNIEEYPGRPSDVLAYPALIRLRMTASLQESSPRISTGSCSANLLLPPGNCVCIETRLIRLWPTASTDQRDLSWDEDHDTRYDYLEEFPISTRMFKARQDQRPDLTRRYH
jgi:hypothetical protein